jgi:hypothetical protein
MFRANSEEQRDRVPPSSQQEHAMNIHALAETTQSLFADNKALLVMDESNPT